MSVERLRVVVARSQFERHRHALQRLPQVTCRCRQRETRAARLPGRAQRKTVGSVAACGRTCNDTDRGILQQAGERRSTPRDLRRDPAFRETLGQHRSQRLQVRSDHRRIEIAGRIRFEILDRAGRTDIGAREPADRQPVYLQPTVPEAQRGIERFCRHAGGRHRSRFDFEGEIAVGKTCATAIADEE